MKNACIIIEQSYTSAEERPNQYIKRSRSRLYSIIKIKEHITIGSIAEVRNEIHDLIRGIVVDIIKTYGFNTQGMVEKKSCKNAEHKKNNCDFPGKPLG